MLICAIPRTEISENVWNTDCVLTFSSQLFDLVDALRSLYLLGGRYSVEKHLRCVIQSVASSPCHTALVCAPVRELSLYLGTRQSVLCASLALCLSHVPLTSGLWGSQLLKQCKAHYSHRSLQSAMVSQPSLGRYRPLLLAFFVPPPSLSACTLNSRGPVRRGMLQMTLMFLWSDCMACFWKCWQIYTCGQLKWNVEDWPLCSFVMQFVMLYLDLF